MSNRAANTLQIVPNTLLATYLERVPKGLQAAFDALQDAEISTPDFSFYTSVSSVFSSKIEREKAWFVQSEKMYYLQHQTYYKNIRLLGLEYPESDYNQALPFLLMLPDAVVNL